MLHPMLVTALNETQQIIARKTTAGGRHLATATRLTDACAAATRLMDGLPETTQAQLLYSLQKRSGGYLQPAAFVDDAEFLAGMLASIQTGHVYHADLAPYKTLL